LITGDRKPLAEVRAMVDGLGRVLVLGCGTCVTVCMAGGEREAEELALAMRLADKEAGAEREVWHANVERQCDAEFLEAVRDQVERADAVVSLACGCGVQHLATVFPGKVVYPGLNTTFMGVAEELGVWSERCLGCGDCLLDRTGGVCPITRCSKSLLNGPCGGSADGKCEVDPDIPCGWQLIHDRLSAIGQLHRLDEVLPPKDWSTSHSGGPRKRVREDVRGTASTGEGGGQ
jgi:ferredoxin